MWSWTVAWAVPGTPEVRYEMEGASPVAETASGASPLAISGCTLGAPSFHPAFGEALDCPTTGAANTAAWDPLFAYGDAFTVAAWVYVPDVDLCPGGDTLCTFVAQGNTDSPGAGFMLHTRARTLRLTVHDGSGGETFLSAPAALPEGRWVHLAARVDGSRISLFEDGGLQADGDVGLHVVHEANAPLRVGHTANRAYDLLGSIDEVLLFRRPLSDTEVADLYAWYVDDDGDGFTGEDDCDDTAIAVFPGATEVRGDGIDQDCDGGDLPAGHTGLPTGDTGTTGDTGVAGPTGDTAAAGHTDADTLPTGGAETGGTGGSTAPRHTGAAAHSGAEPTSPGPSRAVWPADPGCGCAAVEGAGALPLAGVALLALRRRRR